MIRENRIRIDQYVIFLPFSAVETDVHLLLRSVIPAQEARTCIERSGIRSGSGRDYSGRVMLHPDREPTDGQFPDMYIFQRPEILTGQRPAGELVIDELAYVLTLCHIVNTRCTDFLHGSVIRPSGPSQWHPFHGTGSDVSSRQSPMSGAGPCTGYLH